VARAVRIARVAGFGDCLPPEMDNDVTVQIEPAAAAGTKETRVFVTEKGYEPDKLTVRAVRPRELRSFGLRRRRAGLRWCFRPSTSGVPCRSTSRRDRIHTARFRGNWVRTRDEHAPRDSRGAMTSEHIAEYESTCREVEFGFVSELCQIPLETPVKHRRLRGDIDAYQCCGKLLIGSALVRFSERQHARAESISKRAPSTTRPSLRLESITCERSGTV
jgi:hypothetical protein